MTQHVNESFNLSLDNSIQNQSIIQSPSPDNPSLSPYAANKGCNTGLSPEEKILYLVLTSMTSSRLHGMKMNAAFHCELRKHESGSTVQSAMAVFWSGCLSSRQQTMMHDSFDKLSVSEVTYQCPMLLPKACWLLNDFTFFFSFSTKLILERLYINLESAVNMMLS